MSGNRSLDEFGAPDDAEEPDPASVEAAATDPPDSTSSAEAVEQPDPDAASTADEPPDPPASTYVWGPDGGPCAACGERAEERWRDGDDLVCGDCKEW